MANFQTPGRSAVFAANGMCATSHPLAAQIAIDMLRRGGNAVDAAIAGAMLLGVCEPHMCGIGGDCFALVSQPGRPDIVSLNGSGRAPAGADAGALRDKGTETIGLCSPESVTVPGAIDAFCRLSADHGRLGLADSLAPAIHYADEGVPVSPRTAADWPGCAKVLQGKARERFLPGGSAPATGQIFRAPGKAEVLRRVARHGRDGFYTGEVAEDMVAALAARGGVHAMADFAACSSDYTDAISGRYKGVDLVEHPPNGQGATAILMLNILAQFDLAALDPEGSARVHLETEAAKLAYDARNRLVADPAIADHGARMTDPGLAADLAALIRADRVIADPPAATEAVHRDTVYITVVDRDRMAVSLIFSLFHGFGSGIASEKFGLLLQNRGAGFTLAKGHPNEYGPGKRPMHTIIPALLRENGDTTMSFGVMGGQYQPAGHARFVSDLRDFGRDPQTAIDAPRSFPDGGALMLETGYCDRVAQELTDLGHRVVRPAMGMGGAQAIRIDPDGVLEGASDPRKDGCALGY